MSDRTLEGHTPARAAARAQSAKQQDAPTIRLTPRIPTAEPLRALHDLSELPRRFKVLGTLGEGGAGVVLCAHDTVLRRDVAIKVLHHSDALEEARAAAELRHESIVTIFDVDPGGRYIVMELIDGETLQQRLVRRGRLDAPAVYELARALLGALAIAHERGIIHRDIKPANILFDKKGRIKLNDFGVARRTSPTPSLANLEADSIAGTPAYMAPEVWEGAEADPRADIFGVGVTLWEAAVGAPFRADFTPEDFEARQVLEQTRDPRLATAIARALAPKPADRFASVAEFAHALGPIGRPRRVGWIAGTVLAGAAAIGITAFALAGSPTPAAEPERPFVVATVPFVDRTGKLSAARTELPSLLAAELRYAARVQVVSHDQIIERTTCALQTEELAAWRACAATFQADAIVSGTLVPDGDRVTVELAISRLDGTRLGTLTAHATPPGVSALVRRHAPQIADLAAGRSAGDIAIDPDLDLGIEALHQAKYPEAQVLLRKVLARDPDQVDALYHVAIALYWQNAPRPETDAAFDRALAAPLSEVQDGIVRGFRLLDRHDLTGAIAHFKKLADKFPTYTIVQYGLTEALFHGGFPADGVARYRKLADSDRDFRLALMHPFDFYVVRGDTEGAAWALARAQRFDITNSTEWQVRMRVMGGDVSGAYSALVAEHAEAERRGRPSPFPHGMVVLAILQDDRALAAKLAIANTNAKLGPTSEIALALWRGDPTAARRAVDELVSAARSRGRRGTFEASRIAVLLGIADDRLAATALAALDDTAKGDIPLAVNEQLGRVFLLARTGNAKELASYVDSPVPEVAHVAAALQANHEGKPAADLWQQAFALSADGVFVITGKVRLAEALHAAKDHAAVLATCRDVLQPRVIDVALAAGTVPCLVWSGDAAEALGQRAVAIAHFRRVLAIRSAPGDTSRTHAVAALARLVR